MLKGKVAIITDGTREIEFASAKKFDSTLWKRRKKVILLFRNRGK